MKVFQEKLYKHHSQTFTIDVELYRGQTEFQEVLIFENRLLGRVLVLDGIVQLTQRDNHIYHEMLAHVPLMAHARAKSVLIIGGGDGGILKEILKYPVRQVVMVELDKEVVALSKRYFSGVSNGAFEDSRVTLIAGNGVEYVAQTAEKFDAIIVDSTDPIGLGEALFTRSFYEGCRKLLRPDGILSLQSGAPFYNPEQLQAVCTRLAFSFESVRPYLAPVPTYAGGMLALVAAGDSHKALRPPKRMLQERFQRLHMHTDYYSPEIHRAAFTLPPRFPSCGTTNGEGLETSAQPA